MVVLGIFLSVTAVRTINREETYTENQIEHTLLTEVVYLVSLVENELGWIERDLAESVPPGSLSDPEKSLL